MWGEEEIAIENNAAAGLTVKTRLFLETFPNSSGVRKSIDYNGWRAYWGDACTPYTGTTTAYGTSNQVGAADTVPINAGYPEGTNTANGYFFTGGNSRRIEVMMTDKVSIDLSVFPKLEIPVTVGHSRTGVEHRILVLVNGSWYSGPEKLFNSVYNDQNNDALFSTKSQTLTFHVGLDTEWSPVVVDPGVALSPDNVTKVVLTEGIIEEIGLQCYSALTTNKFRFDSYAVDALSVQRVAASRSKVMARMDAPGTAADGSNSVTVNWLFRTSRPVIADTVINFNLYDGGITTAHTATMLAGSDAVAFPQIYAKKSVQRNVSCILLSGTGYYIGVNIEQTATVGPAETTGNSYTSFYADTTLYSDTKLYL